VTLDQQIGAIELLACELSGCSFVDSRWTDDFGNATLRVEAGSRRWSMQAAIRDDRAKAKALVASTLLTKMAKEAGRCPCCQEPHEREKGRRRHRCKSCLHVWTE